MACFIRGKLNFKNNKNQITKTNLHHNVIDVKYSDDKNLQAFENTVFNDIKESNILLNSDNKLLLNEYIINKTKSEINFENSQKRSIENKIFSELNGEKDKIKNKFIKILNKQGDFNDMKKVGSGK